MRKNLFIVCLFLLYSAFSFAQVNKATQFVYGDLSYGFETNVGNTGLLIGVGYQRNLNYKFIFQADLHHFNSEIINANWQMTEPNNINLVSDRSVFLSTALGYALIGNEYKFNLTLKGGPTLSYNDMYMRNGGTFKFANRAEKVRFGLNLGLDINIPIKKNFLTIGFLSYSTDIPLQYLFAPLPVISYKVKF